MFAFITNYTKVGAGTAHGGHPEKTFQVLETWKVS